MKAQLRKVYVSNVVDQPIKQQKQHVGFLKHLYEDIVLNDDAVRATLRDKHRLTYRRFISFHKH